jgi:diguanylate cyclase (GGDEF)-like protein
VEIEDSVIDPVTGAFSRASLLPRLQAELSRVARSGGSCSLFLFDVDFFKTVNDVYGHLRGDEVLHQLAERVQQTVRGHDALFRYGGDEFVVLLPDTGHADAVQLALRLTDQIKAGEFTGEPPLRLSISLGVATYPQDGTDSTALLACADRRNYAAKRRGRAGVVADDETSESEDSGGSRLWQRDSEIAAVHDYLTRLTSEGTGALPVKGQPGVGHTRFLEEVTRLARMRGLTVVPIGSDPVPPPESTRGVLLVADVDGVARVGPTLSRWAEEGPLPQPLGLAYAASDLAAASTPGGMPVLQTVELSPWSPATLRIWLRAALRGEPSRTLTSWFAKQTGGLPAAAVRELDRLRARNGLTPTDNNGGWTLSPVFLGRPRRQVRLPAQLTAFLGREEESRHVARMLTETRLVTLVGPGGVGKTRLSMALARSLADDFDDGVIFVPLADTDAAEQVVVAIAQALGVGDVPDTAPLDTIIDHLAEASLLLVLDNLEHVLDAGPMIGQLLAAAPSISVIVTSREPVAIYGEQVYRVPPLPLPDLATLPADAAGVGRVLGASPAVALFDQRARAANADFVLTAENLSAVAEVCHRLDGLPLAIELTAARCDRMTPPELLAHLRHHLEALGEGPRDRPQRQQTLRGAIDWSIALLDPDEQHLFATFGAFVGGCTADAALAVAGWIPPDPDEHDLAVKAVTQRLENLATKSLILVDTDPDGQSRYRMLRTIHSYAVVKLSIAGAETARDLHLDHYRGFAVRSSAGMAGPEQAEWAARLQLEYPNMRAAMNWALERGRGEAAAEICDGLWRYWRNGEHIREGRDWLERILARRGLADPVRLGLLYPAAVLAATQDDATAASRLGRDGLRLADGLGDRRAAAQAHNILGVSELTVGRYDEAGDHFRYSLAVWRELAEPPGMAIALGNLAKVSLRLGEVEAAREHIDQCLALERAAGNRRGILLGLECLAEVLLARGDLVAARAIADEGLALARELGDVFGEAMALHQLGLAEFGAGNRAEALRLFLAALERRHEVGDRDDLAVSLEAVAETTVDNQPRLAVRLAAAAHALRQRLRLATPADSEPRRRALVTSARTLLGERDFAREWQAGRAAPLDLVVDHALDEASPGRP